MKYRLVFNGELTGEVPKEDCLVQLAQLFGKDFYKVESKLFRGKPIVVKKTSDEQVAKRFISAFEKAGAVLHIETPDLQASDSKPVPTPEPKAVLTQAERDTGVTRMRPTMKKSDILTVNKVPELTDVDMTRQRQAVPDKDDRESRRGRRNK